MRTANRRSRVAHPGRPQQVRAAVALLACLGLTACTATETPSPASTAGARAVAPLPQRGEIDAGTYLVSGYTVPFEVTIPDGWVTGDGSNLFKDDPRHPEDGAVVLVFWPADYVPTDACAWRGSLVPVGPTAEAFVDAVTAQGSAVSSNPIEVVVGDYSGLEFEHSVESGIDINDCDAGRFCVHSDRAQECSRWYTDRGERETYRVVDLDGERAVIAVGRFYESVDPALITEARAVFDSIQFVAPDE
jgi:hypothetical protein